MTRKEKIEFYTDSLAATARLIEQEIYEDIACDSDHNLVDRIRKSKTDIERVVLEWKESKFEP